MMPMKEYQDKNLGIQKTDFKVTQKIGRQNPMGSRSKSKRGKKGREESRRANCTLKEQY